MDALQVKNVPSFIWDHFWLNWMKNTAVIGEKAKCALFIPPHFIDGPKIPPFLGLKTKFPKAMLQKRILKILAAWHGHFELLKTPSLRIFFFFAHEIQPWPLAIKRLLNNPYVNGVNLTKQNPLLKCRQHLETLHTLKKGLDLLMLKILGL